ncbi:MAG TPA: TadE/TadG family type IV pilus assembly protein [Alphaproteobacteria bacterium]
MGILSFRSWFQKNEGTTAIEFSLLAVPFVFFVIGIIELSILFLNEALLNGAVYDAARMIRTGQAQQSDDPEAMFADALCDHAGLLLDCNNIEYQVETLESFDDAELEPEVDEDGHIIDTPFDAGEISDIVIVRVLYLYPLMTPFIGRFFSDFPDNRKLLMATTVFETEPYDFEEE